MPLHTNYGDHLSVTVTRLRKGEHGETVMFSVQQRLYDDIRAEQGLTPHMPCGFGFVPTVRQGLDAGLGQAHRVKQAGDELDACVRADRDNRRSTKASPETMEAMAHYNHVVFDERDDWGSQGPENPADR
jgi:hypothetical protein